MIRKSFNLSELKKSKGKLTVQFPEIDKISPYIKEHTKDLLNSLLEEKLSAFLNNNSNNGGDCE